MGSGNGIQVRGYGEEKGRERRVTEKERKALRGEGEAETASAEEGQTESVGGMERKC